MIQINIRGNFPLQESGAIQNPIFDIKVILNVGILIKMISFKCNIKHVY